jgi:hypothetical protein
VISSRTQPASGRHASPVNGFASSHGSGAAGQSSGGVPMKSPIATGVSGTEMSMLSLSPSTPRVSSRLPATHTVPSPATATPIGVSPTGRFAIAASAAASSTVTVSSPVFVT